ncbi:TetR family transcriptional regulator C-terminal domain-containing protein [Amycolatopsis coloradensis]|nr:TetR family transcriptional regulator C-terminal domain-containing protein [Amycolatopsis coloradensis]
MAGIVRRRQVTNRKSWEDRDVDAHSRWRRPPCRRDRLRPAQDRHGLRQGRGPDTRSDGHAARAAGRLLRAAHRHAAAEPGLRGVVEGRDRRYRFAIARTVAAGIADGIIAGVRDPDAYAAALAGQVRGVAVAAIIDPGGIDLRAIRAEMEYAVDRLA